MTQLIDVYVGDVAEQFRLGSIGHPPRQRCVPARNSVDWKQGNLNSDSRFGGKTRARSTAASPAYGLCPYLTIPNGLAEKAIAFYRTAFSAVERGKVMSDDGEVVRHCQLEINGAILMLADDFSEPSGPPVSSTRGIVVQLNVEDVDGWWRQARGAGATVVIPLANRLGRRSGKLQDPFGFLWSISGPENFKRKGTPCNKAQRR